MYRKFLFMNFGVKMWSVKSKFKLNDLLRILFWMRKCSFSNIRYQKRRQSRFFIKLQNFNSNMSCFCTAFTVRDEAARAKAARRHGTYITCRASACRAVPTRKPARGNPRRKLVLFFCRSRGKTVSLTFVTARIRLSNWCQFWSVHVDPPSIMGDGDGRNDKWRVWWS